MIRHLLAAAVLLCAAPAIAQDAGSIVLHPGERVVVVQLDGGELVVAPGGQAELTEFDIDAVVNLLESYADATGPNAAVVSEGDTPAPEIAPNAVRISFLALDTGKARPEMLLVLENGFEREFRYKAIIAAGDQSQATDVCTVLPVLRGYEHWPYPFERIELSSLTLLPARPGEAPTCE